MPDGTSGAWEPEALHVERQGREGSPILLIHGLGTSGYTWRRWVPALAPSHRVYTVDLLGFGQSQKPRDASYHPREQASLLAEWILRAGLQDLTLVGHSLGGAVALLATLELQVRSQRSIRRLAVLAGIAYPQPISPFIRLLGRRILGSLSLWLLPPRLVIWTALRRAYHPSRSVPRDFVEAYARGLRSPGGRRTLRKSAAQLLSADPDLLAGHLGALEVPCLLLWGDQDPVVPLRVGRRMASEIPEARLEVLAECGHMVQEEVPEASLRHLFRFLAETD